MMHGLGDCRKPLHESAALVEEIVQQQLMILMYKAGDVASSRGAKLIGIEDILFLMRKDKVKLRRLLRYMKFRDVKSAVSRTASVDEDEPPEHGEKQHPVSKRRKLCYDFLSMIDQTGELSDLFDDDSTDDIKHERLLRADIRSRCLEPQQYLEFCESRQVNFSRKYKSQRFKDWLFNGLNLDIKPSIHCLEILSYLAYETVAQIIDLALLVKRDMSASPADPLVQSFPSATHNFNETAEVIAILGQSKSLPTITSPTVSPPTTPVTTASGLSSSSSSGPSSKTKSKKKKKGGLPETLKSQIQPIRPSDIREVMRRYTGCIGPFASELKGNPLYQPRNTLLCT